MKKFYFALAVAAAALLVSCEREKSFEDITPVGEGEVAFAIQGTATKASGVSSKAVKGITIPLGILNGESLSLEETIEELNPNPATKGAPAYTENVGNIYDSLRVWDSTTEGEVPYELMDTCQHDKNNAALGYGWRYKKFYPGTDPWPDETTDVDFYLRMPSVANGVTVTGRTGGSTTFKLTSPLDGEEQQDLLFGYVAASKEYHNSMLPNGVPVTMYHALSGIKFRNGHDNDNQTKTIIKKVEIIGLNGYGECTITADGTATWSNTGTPSTATAPFVLDFGDTEYTASAGADNPDGTISYTKPTTGEAPFGNSWYSAAADKNLNDTTGSLTFWFIPQAMTDDVTLKVYFTVKTPDSADGFVTDACHTIYLGSLLNENYTASGKTGSVEWGAGQLRTYTLKPFEVDVEIKDAITDTKKSDLHIANTGNVDEYVRMLIMGNWYGWESEESKANGDEPSILVGYQYQSPEAAAAAGHSDDPMVLPWYREGYDLDNNASTPNVDPYGAFDSSFTLASLGETSDANARDGKRYDWADASGGFYYTMPIGPGDGVNTTQSATKDLFKSYTVSSIPTIYIATNGVQRTEAVGVHLVMEIVVQAIAVPKDDEGNDVWWLQAWYDATGISKLNPEAERNEDYKALYEAGEYDAD